MDFIDHTIETHFREIVAMLSLYLSFEQGQFEFLAKQGFSFNFTQARALWHGRCVDFDLRQEWSVSNSSSIDS